MRGIDFKCNNIYDRLIDKLFKNIPIEQYIWYIPEHEVLYNDGFSLDMKPKMDGKEFKKFIELSGCLVYSINIQAFPRYEKYVKLMDYKDFIKSKCEMVLFIVDSSYGELYVKKSSLFLQFINNLEEAKCTEIKIKTDYEDGRTQFSIW